MSTFHWHITDSQSFPLEVVEFPELAMMGAYSPEEVYTAADVSYIVSYAASVRSFIFFKVSHSHSHLFPCS